VKGKVWKFGNDVDTDAITPSKYLGGSQAELREHILGDVNPRFPKEVKAGDMIVAGSNFGCGSSRESAPVALKAVGIAAIAAESFARIFFRNAIAIGLPIITCPDLSASFADGDEMELDFATAKITNVTRSKILHGQPLPEQMLQVLAKGGIVPMLKEMGKKAKQ
jgi:3-isopropylmalate/(R)-2-methylmalate dehydratase small subunit